MSAPREASTSRNRPWLAAALAVAVVVGVSAPSKAEPASSRSGHIVSGVMTTSPSWSCRYVPDCRAWLVSGCDPALAGRDPGWLASIVPVADLADGVTERTFAYGPARPAGVVPGGVTVEFWSAGCKGIDEFRVWTSRGGWTWGTAIVVVPPSAAWMTVTANDKVNMAWRLD